LGPMESGETGPGNQIPGVTGSLGHRSRPGGAGRGRRGWV